MGEKRRVACQSRGRPRPHTLWKGGSWFTFYSCNDECPRHKRCSGDTCPPSCAVRSHGHPVLGFPLGCGGPG